MKRYAISQVIREMQTNVIIVYHVAHTRKAKMKKTDNTKCCQGLEQMELSCSNTESKNWYNNFGNYLAISTKAEHGHISNMTL